ncbi:hypothetical protein FPSM_01150 [Flavobacterium psychrophilum]|nr:hypothetical protein FPSM_01150 [Flavobacterium psychrophilum]
MLFFFRSCKKNRHYFFVTKNKRFRLTIINQKIKPFGNYSYNYQP